MSCGKSGDEVIAPLATENSEDLIPSNAATAVVINFLNGLSSRRPSKSIDCLFDCTEGQAYEQVVDSTKWLINTKITIKILEAFKTST